MKNKMNIKSALIGLAIGVAITLGVGAASSPSGSVGRYQVAGAGNTAVIIDTTTGKVWRGYFSPTSGITDGDFLAPKSTDMK